LVHQAHVVLNESQPAPPKLNLAKIAEHFEARCSSMHRIPFDPHLAEGGEFEFGRLRAQTEHAYLDLATSVSQQFSHR
jgi:MinD-like ATPase involved in chromosome partitioning or flagellar assembly